MTWGNYPNGDSNDCAVKYVFSAENVCVSDGPLNTDLAVVLLVDDSDDDVLLFKRAFKDAGINNRLRIVRDGEQAIAYLSGAGKFADRATYPLPALMLLDLKMPRKDGFEILQWVREQEELKGVHVVVLTTSGDFADVKRAYELGANSFIVKSHDMQEFVGQLKEVQRHWL